MSNRPCVFEHENCIIVEFTPDGKDGRSVVAKGEWDSETEYIFDDLVSYQGSSYIALRTVPAGTLPTDTEYWMVNASGNTVPWGNIVGTLADQTDLKDALDLKADASTVYTKTEADALLALKADASAVYTKTEADTLLSAKADASTVYTKTETDTLLSAKADSADVYTKTQTDSLLSAKADSSDVYSKSQTDTLLSAKADTSSLGDLATLDTVDYDTQVTNKPTLGALASKDTVDYETDITNLPTLGTMSAVNDAPSDDKPYARKNGDWAEVTGGGGGDAVWGGISGTLSDQTDLANALQNKADVIVASVSGSVASFPDGMASPVVGLTVGVEPVQDLHGQSSPWPAGGGKNLYPDQDKTINATNYGVVGVFKNSNVKITGTATQGGGRGTIKSDNFTLSAGTYYFKKFNETGTPAPTIFIQNGTEILSNTFTLAEESASICITVNVANESTYNYSADVVVSTEDVSAYSPYSNLCPISGHSSATVTRTGGNAWDEQWEVGLIDASTGQNTSSDSYSRTKNYVPVKPNTEYYMCPVSKTLYIRKYGADKTYLGYQQMTATTNHVLTTDSDTHFIRFCWDGTTYANDISVNYPSTETEYIPNNGEPVTVTIPFGQTVYGAVLDVVGRRLTVDRVAVDMGDLDWSYSSNVLYSTSTPLFGSGGKALVSASAKDICEMYDYKEVTLSTPVNGRFMVSNVQANPVLRVSDNRYTDGSTFKTAISGTKAVFELYEPQVIENLSDAQISILLGQNNIWADTGDCDVQYRADTKLYIDWKINETTLATRQMLTSVETEMKATKNYTSGQTVIVGDSFYKLTSNVANGGTFTPGTNCTQVTMADWILSIV